MPEINLPPSRADHAHYMKCQYWLRRRKVIAFLGGKCQHEGCDCTDESLLEIHHEEPVLYSVKKNGKPRGPRTGGHRFRDWDDIIAGKLPAKIFCHEHHRDIGHGGNCSALKKKKVD